MQNVRISTTIVSLAEKSFPNKRSTFILTGVKRKLPAKTIRQILSDEYETEIFDMRTLRVEQSVSFTDFDVIELEN